MGETRTLADVLDDAVASFSRRILPDLSAQYGRRWTLPTGEVWQLVAQNDLGYPYFVRVRNGKPQKTQYCCGWIEAELIEEATHA